MGAIWQAVWVNKQDRPIVQLVNYLVKRNRTQRAESAFYTHTTLCIHKIVRTLM